MALLDLALSITWAIYPPTLDVIVRLLDRQDVPPDEVAAVFHFSKRAQQEALEAVASRAAHPVENTVSLSRRGPVAVLPIRGPITRYGDRLTSSFGNGQSVETISRDLRTALDDPDVASVLLNIDSPGGEASGISELADQIYDARSIKPIRAYVSDAGASAAYWLASAATDITVAKTAMLGSIGAVMAVRDTSRSRDVEIVSSVSPNKRPDVSTVRGRSQYQVLVDRLGEIFVDAVARNRAVEREVVLQDFGAGGLVVGSDTVDVGMADAVGSFEALVEQMQADAERGYTKPAPLRRVAQMGLRDRIISFVRDLPDDSEPASATWTTTNTLPVALESRAPEPIPGTLEQAVDPPTPDHPAPTAEEARPVESTKPSTSAESEELIRLRAENRRLLLERIQSQAAAFATVHLSQHRAFPGEEDAIKAAFVQAALDDHHVGVDADEPSRVQLLSNLFAARVPVNQLTAEHLGSAVASVISHRVSAPRGDEPNPERIASLASMTSLGRPNGTASN